MNDELQEAKISAMECDIKEIKQDIKEMPDLIVKKVNESVDMKIKLAIAETEKKYMGKFIALLIGLIGEAVGLIISFIKSYLVCELCDTFFFIKISYKSCYQSSGSITAVFL